MSCQNLVRFLYETQQEEDAVVAAPALIQRYEPNERGRLETWTSLFHILLSRWAVNCFAAAFFCSRVCHFLCTAASETVF